jgi:hypothetical protein
MALPMPRDAPVTRATLELEGLFMAVSFAVVGW